MTPVEVANAVLLEPDIWVSGLYFSPEGLCPAIVIAQSTREQFDVFVYQHISLGLGPISFLAYERLSWPVGSAHAYLFGLIDETNLELTREIPIAEIGPDGFWYDLDGDVEELAALFCRHLSQLVPYEDSDVDFEDSLEISLEAFDGEFPGLREFPTPNFWTP